MSYLDTVLVNGHDVRTLTGCKVYGQIYHWAPGERRGDDDDVLGRDGSIAARLPRVKFVVRVPIQIVGATRGARNDNLRNVLTQVGGGVNGIVSLTRRIAKGSGSSYDEHTANGRFLSANTITLFTPATGRTELQFYNLNGAWWTGAAWTTP